MNDTVGQELRFLSNLLDPIEAKKEVERADRIREFKDKERGLERQKAFYENYRVLLDYTLEKMYKDMKQGKCTCIISENDLDMDLKIKTDKYDLLYKLGSLVNAKGYTVVLDHTHEKNFYNLLLESYHTLYIRIVDLEEFPEEKGKFTERHPKEAVYKNT